MFKKLFFLCLICFFTLTITGCHKPNTIILFNKYPITKDNLLDNASEFVMGTRIYYIFITEKTLDTDTIRVRILKREEKCNMEPVKVVYSNDYRLNRDQVFYFTDYIIMNETGYYCMLIYASDKLNQPLIKADFRVKQL